MAFNTGVKDSPSVVITRYGGVASCSVLAVNPDDATASELLGHETTVTPYVNEVEINGRKVKNVRLDFIVKTDEKAHGVAVSNKLTMFIQDSFRESSKGLIQVIDKYGRTAWVTKEELASHSIPMYSNGPANISSDYRPCYIGEEYLTQFFISLLNIPNVQKWDNKLKKFSGLIDNPSDAEARLDNITDYFNGKFDEIKKILSYQPNNKVKLLWGVRTSEKDGQTRVYQVIYNRMFLPNRVTNYNKFVTEISNRKENGALANEDYPICNFAEYAAKPTDLNKVEAEVPSDLPWD